MERTEGQEISSACLTAIRQPASPTAVHELEQLGKTNKNSSSTMALAKLLIKESSLHPCFKQLASTLHISQNIGVKKAGKQTNQPHNPTIRQTNKQATLNQCNSWDEIRSQNRHCQACGPIQRDERFEVPRGATRRLQPASCPTPQLRFPPNPMVSHVREPGWLIHRYGGNYIFFALLQGKRCIVLNKKNLQFK